MTHHAIFDTYPQLEHAIQPPKLPRVSGSFSFNPAAEFEELKRRVECGTFRLRAPQPDLSKLVGPFRGTGTCLAPVLYQQYLWIDPTLEPADGDFVLVSLDPEELAGIIERGKDDPEWIATYGQTPGPIVTKILKSIGHMWYLAERETGFQLTGFGNFGKPPRDNRVLGVVRAVIDMGSGRMLYDAPLAHAIGQNAATFVSQRFTAGPVNVSGSGALQSATVDSFTPPAQSVDCTLQVQVSYNVAQGSVAGSQITDLNLGAMGSNQIAVLGSVATPVSQTIMYQFAYTGGSTPTLNLNWAVNSPAGPNSATYSNIQWKAEFIKR